MSRKVLGISWLNGRFHAVALNGGAVSSSWSCPTAVNDEAAFAPALAEAVRQTRFTGAHVMLVLDHRSLLFHVQETPPATGKLVDQMLQRLIERSQFFEARAAWGRLNLPSTKGRLRFLLTLLPEPLVHQLVEVCAVQRLELLGIFPLPAVLADHLRALPLPAEQTVLLAADLGGALHLLLGKGDGTVLFSRTVVIGAAPAGDRAAQEINRTLHFAQQQFGANVTQLFVFGAEAFAALKDLPIRPGLKVQSSPVAEEPLYYARRVAALPQRGGLNLVSSSKRTNQRLQQAAAIGVAALFCVSVASAVCAQFTVRARESAAANLARQVEAENQALAAAMKLQNQAARWRTFLQVVGTTNEPPVAELFAHYIGTVVPDTVRLTQVDVNRTTAGWNCRIEGVAREQREGFIAQMETFERELQNGLFKLHITDSTHQRFLHGNADGTSAAQSRPTTRDNERPFFVTATIP